MEKTKFDLDMYHLINGNQVMTKEDYENMTNTERRNAITQVYACIHTLIASNILEGPVWDRLKKAEEAFDIPARMAAISK